MLIQESRRSTRTSPDGDLILLEHQDRSLWNKDQIAEGISLTESALASRRYGAFTLQAAIAAIHAKSSSAATTDWRQITLLYDRLLQIQPSPVVELNRAVAIAMGRTVKVWNASTGKLISSLEQDPLCPKRSFLESPSKPACSDFNFVDRKSVV